MPHGWLQKDGSISLRACSRTVWSKLSGIVGNCDLLYEKTEKGTDYARRLAVIRDLAESAAKELANHQRNVENKKAG